MNERERIKREARECCKEIIDDLSDRRGLRQEWEQIDDGVQSEIRDVWSGFILALVLRERAAAFESAAKAARVASDSHVNALCDGCPRCDCADEIDALAAQERAQAGEGGGE